MGQKSPRGWRGNSYGHMLASKGVRTSFNKGQQKELKRLLRQHELGNLKLHNYQKLADLVNSNVEISISRYAGDVVHTISEDDVGKRIIPNIRFKEVKSPIPIKDVIGEPMIRDVGKQIIEVKKDVFQVENDEQLRKRILSSRDEKIRASKEIHLKNIEDGHYRSMFGLESDSDSLYSFLRKSMSDAEAQYEVYKKRGLIE